MQTARVQASAHFRIGLPASVFRTLVKRALLTSMLLSLLATPAAASARPRVADFELAPPGAAHASGLAVASAVLPAPRRLSPVGLRRRGSAQATIHLRVRRGQRP